jgi:1-acyl-sn-glycerol-3-phosphate acyltransferase
MAKKELFSIPLLSGLIRALGAFPIDRSGNDVGAIKNAVKMVEEGKCLGVFPQGHRYPGVDPATTKLHSGAALIAYHAKCDVVPVCINVKGGKYSFLRKVEVIFGKTIKYEELGFIDGGREEYTAATEKIFAEIIRLGNFNALPPYDPAKDKINNRKKKKK